jgi:hypothetical protein
MIGLNASAQNPPRSDDMLLTDEFIQCAGTHARCERLLRLDRLVFLRKK